MKRIKDMVMDLTIVIRGLGYEQKIKGGFCEKAGLNCLIIKQRCINQIRSGLLKLINS